MKPILLSPESQGCMVVTSCFNTGHGDLLVLFNISDYVDE